MMNILTNRSILTTAGKGVERSVFVESHHQFLGSFLRHDLQRNKNYRNKCFTLKNAVQY